MSSKGTPSKPAIVTPASGLRLDSWKEIAAYLKRSPRTVSRWEREEGLPVHRHLHRKKETVYAFSDKIDAWLKSRGKLESTGLGPGPPTSAPSPGFAKIAKQDALSPRPLMLAVLPLRNLTGNAAKEVFADALTDEIISELGQLNPGRLRVIAFTSVAHYKQSSKDIQQIGKELGVDYLMEGGVRWYGRRVRVTARLICVRDQAQIWAESFEIQLPPLFALQQGLARELAGALSAKLGLPLTRAPGPETTCIPAAHDAYLLGTHQSHWTEADIKKGLDLFSRALEIDPNCAPPYAELALAWFRLGFLYDYPPAATLWATRELALRALALDPKLWSGHAAMATWNLFGAWNWAEAEASCQRALDINPSDRRTRMTLASYHLVVQRPDEAIKELRQAMRLDPLSPPIGIAMVILGFFAGSYDMAIEGCQKLLSHDASSALVHMMLGACFAKKGDYARALTHCEKARALGKGQIIYTATLCSVCAGAGQRSSAERLLQEMVTLTKQQYVRCIFLAQAAVNLENKEHTLQWLEKAYEQHDPLLVFLKADPRFEPLARSARFRNLLGRIGLPS
jgi:TolB-like protein/Flp pilus assembly protein TadD